jgi:hypothetical protein
MGTEIAQDTTAEMQAKFYACHGPVICGVMPLSVSLNEKKTARSEWSWSSEWKDKVS